MRGYTTIEQSKMLMEIGIPNETADMYFIFDIVDDYYDVPSFVTESPMDIRCWSLAALLGLMPSEIIENNNSFEFYQVKGRHTQGERYRFGYKTNNNYFRCETLWYNNPIDAAVEMIIWLKENEKI